MGRSLHSYVCVDLLSVREGSPSKGGFDVTHGTSVVLVKYNFN